MLPQRAGLPGLKGCGAAATVPPVMPLDHSRFSQATTYHICICRSPEQPVPGDSYTCDSVWKDDHAWLGYTRRLQCLHPLHCASYHVQFITHLSIIIIYCKTVKQLIFIISLTHMINYFNRALML